MQLRIANIELHETAFSGQIHPRAGGGLNNTMYHQPSAVTTTVKIQGPTVSDFNQIFSPSTVQVSTTTVLNNGIVSADPTYRQYNNPGGNHRGLPGPKHEMLAAAQAHFNRH